MNAMEQATKQFSDMLEKNLNEVFLPTLLSVIMPVIILVIVFSIVRLKFRLTLPKKAYYSINILITIAFLITFAKVTLPTIIDTIVNMPMPKPYIIESSDPLTIPEDLPVYDDPLEQF